MTTRMLRLAIVVGALAAAPVHADQCAGGVNGGMDATGNECNDSTAYAISAASDVTVRGEAPTSSHASAARSIERVAHQRPRAARHRTHTIGAPQRVSTDALNR